MTRVHAIVLAAGGGTRFGSDTPKQFLRLAGEPILARSLRAVLDAGVDDVVVVAHPAWLDETRQMTDEVVGDRVRATVVAGGETRNESTRAGLASVEGDDDDVVLVHDAVRPLVPQEVIRRSIEPIRGGRAEATDTVIPSTDTLVVVDGDAVVEIPDRARFRRGQTPQAFRKSTLERAYEAAVAAGDLRATDDLTLVLRHVPGARVVTVAGDESNVKITTRLDLVLADRLIQMRTIEAPAGDATSAGGSVRGARIAVVGGTHGIGEAIAIEARRRGARVEVAGRSAGLDIRDHASVADWLDRAAGDLGGLDHVVVTAGIMHVGPLAASAPATFAEVVDVNLIGSLNVAHAAHRHLAVDGGSLTLFASSSFTRGRAEYVAYSASKAAIVNAAQGLADEWHAAGIRVNAVSPERTATEMRRRAFPNESSAGMLSPAEVAMATLRLIESDLTGQVIDVRGFDRRA